MRGIFRIRSGYQQPLCLKTAFLVPNVLSPIQQCTSPYEELGCSISAMEEPPPDSGAGNTEASPYSRAGGTEEPPDSEAEGEEEPPDSGAEGAEELPDSGASGALAHHWMCWTCLLAFSAL